MHDNRKSHGLNGARFVGHLGIFTIILRKITSRKGKERKSTLSWNEPDFLGDAWENVDMMRRRMTL